MTEQRGLGLGEELALEALETQALDVGGPAGQRTRGRTTSEVTHGIS